LIIKPETRIWASGASMTASADAMGSVAISKNAIAMMPGNALAFDMGASSRFIRSKRSQQPKDWVVSHRRDSLHFRLSFAEHRLLLRHSMRRQTFSRVERAQSISVTGVVYS
jgi:hypothetical protein